MVTSASRDYAESRGGFLTGLDLWANYVDGGSRMFFVASQSTGVSAKPPEVELIGIFWREHCKISSGHEESGYAVRERRFRKFSRTIKLPRGVTDEQIKASLENAISTGQQSFTPVMALFIALLGLQAAQLEELTSVHPSLQKLLYKGKRITSTRESIKLQSYDGFRSYKEVKRVLDASCLDHDENFKQLNSTLNKEVAEFELAATRGTHSSSEVGQVYKPSFELEAKVHVHVLDGRDELSPGSAASTAAPGLRGGGVVEEDMVSLQANDDSAMVPPDTPGAIVTDTMDIELEESGTPLPPPRTLIECQPG
ncbi:hypothetical protein M378DRAFT_7841 [Amanita muscaria Koide BX008]|uniref:SHSP domain-containing protein n=1 Tax=Amanita muscaria (strain Koide BX008) TaxID=946122 RepID=A0A0C2X4E7_AMAMK|nr:hypothetical protein M378DRAFT_7841 [Amanita muscaria Koide BX008]